MDTDLPPEVKQLIPQYLTQHDLTQLALVNKSWSESAIPAIWTSIWILSDIQGHILRRGYETHHRHFHHIESFHTRGLIYAMILLRPNKNDIGSGTPRLRSLDIMVPYMRTYMEPGGPQKADLEEGDEVIREELQALEYYDDISSDNDVEFDYGKDRFVQEYDTPLLMCHKDEEGLLKILKMNPQLQSFRLSMLPDNPQDFLIHLAPLLPCLKHLELFHMPKRHRPAVNVAVIDAFLRNCASTLESLTLGVKLNATATEMEMNKTKELLRPLIESNKDKTHPALKLLRFLDPVDKYKAEVLIPFIQGCRNMKMIDAPAMGEYEREDHDDWTLAVPKLHAAFQKTTGHRIGAFKAIYWPVESDGEIANLISAFKGLWRTISLSLTDASTLTAGAIINTCHEGLNSLALVTCGEFSSEEIQAILTNATHLRHLECNRWFCDLGQSMLMAQDIISSIWSCAWLVRLNIHIGGIPRPDIRCTEDGGETSKRFELDNCTTDETYALQRKVYQQLGRLTLLEELHLGYSRAGYAQEDQPYGSDSVQRNCLELTLKSGLDELCDLKCLRELGVAFMAHRIEEDEVDWMVVNWPNLHTIQGVLHRRFVEGVKSGYQGRWKAMMRGRGLTYA
ncbi:hypothetical protein BGZ96_000866 [Linnemannia gamsii]|uniref:F-box domain-containing protein n=1 Tax=Linnemannia gamsii TaxID=64522 RepID=A0ABQ7K9L6_9FUNG|nr:hypothetical protein BGZ96_000866 [Linnemannia gamsii]